MVYDTEQEQVEVPSAAAVQPVEGGVVTGGPPRRGRGAPATGPRTWVVRAWQLAIVAGFLLTWQYAPRIPGITDTFSFMDPFFISSPTLVLEQLGRLATGADGATTIWAPLLRTLTGALTGTVLALIVGAIAGLTASNWEIVMRISRPFLTFVNAVPKVAVIPIIVLLVSSSNIANASTAFLSVFFLAFYNSLEGASTVPREMIQNARILGASNSRVMWKVRWPYALAWTLATLPNAIAFGLTATVTTEILTGGSGLGYQLVLGINNSNATQLFAIVIIVSIVGVALVLGSAGLKRLLLPWWGN